MALGDQGAAACLVIGAFFFLFFTGAPAPAPDERQSSFNFHSQSPKANDFSLGRHICPSVPTPLFVINKSIQHLAIAMSFDRRHSTTPRPSASLTNSLDGAIAERAPRLMIQNEAEEEGGGSNALLASTANANHHPLGNVRLSTVINTSNGAMSILSSSLGQVGGDQTCSSPPFTLPFEVYVKISQFVAPDLGQLARLVAVLPPAKREYFLTCYLKDNWSFLVHALLSEEEGEGTFRQRFRLWFSRNFNYLETLETDIEVPPVVRRVLTNPAIAILLDCVDLLRHILDNTDANVNGMWWYLLTKDPGPRSLLTQAIILDRGVCVDYLLSRNDLDVHAVDDLAPRRDPLVFFIISIATMPRVEKYLLRVLQHPSCDINRSHPTVSPRLTMLDNAVHRAILETDPDKLPLHRGIILTILHRGGNPFMSSEDYMSFDLEEVSPFEYARWHIHNGSPGEVRNGQMVFDLICYFITNPEINGLVWAAGAA